MLIFSLSEGISPARARGYSVHNGSIMEFDGVLLVTIIYPNNGTVVIVTTG